MAKRRRLNKRVVILLTAIGVFVGLLLITAIIWTLPKDPHLLAKQAAESLEKKQYADACRDYGQAARATKNPEYMLRWAEALLAYRQNDPRLGQAQMNTLFRQAHTALTEAVRQKPDFVEAQKELTSLDHMIARATGNWMSYIRSADNLIKLDPEDHEIIYQRALAKARVAASIPDYVEPALEDFRAAIDLAPDQEQYRLSLAVFHDLRKEKEQVEKVCLEGIEAIPSSLGLRMALSEFYQREGRNPEGLALLEECIKREPEKADGFLALATYYQRRRDLDKVAEVLKQGTEADPGDYRCFSRLARIHMAGGRPAEAQAALVQGLTAVSDSVGEDPSQLKGRQLQRYRNSVLALNHQLCDVLLDRLEMGGKREETLPAVEEAMAKMRGISPNSPGVVQIEGRLALVEGDLVDAERLLRKAYDAYHPRFDPKTAQLLINLYRRLNQLGEAEQIINRYLALNPSSAPARMTLARLHLDYHNYGKALALVESVVKQQPENEEAADFKIILEVLTGKSDRLPDALEKLTPQDAYILMARGRQIWLEGRQVPALGLVTDVIKRQPGLVSGLVQLIEWYRERKEMDKAALVYEHAKRVFKDNAKVLERLAVMLEPDPDKRLASQLELVAETADPVRRAIRTAQVYRSFGREKEFIEQLRVAEGKDPDNTLVIDWMFEHALKTSDWPVAEKYVQTATKLDLDKVGGRLYEARLARAKGNWEEAIRLTTEVLRLRPRFSQAHAFLGGGYLATKQLDLAKEAYETAQEQNPSNVQALLGLVMVARAQGDSAAYARWVELAYKFRPENPEIREWYLQLRATKDRIEDVVRHREQVRRSQPNNVVNLANLGMLYERVGQLSKAEEVYRTVEKITRGSLQSVRLLANLLRRTDRDVEARQKLANHAARAKDKVAAYLLWASHLQIAEEYEQARILLDKAIESDPKDSRGYITAARFEAALKNWPKAVEQQRKCLTRVPEPSRGRAERDLIHYLIEARNFQEAEERTSNALAKNPEDRQMVALKALAYFLKGDYDKAKEILDQALRQHPGYARALIYRAQVHLASGDAPLAAADLEAARRSNAPPAVTMQLADVYEKMGDFNNAYAVLQSLLTDRSGNVTALRALVDLCHRHRRWTRLQTALSQARKLYPRDLYYVIVEADMWRDMNQPARAIAMLTRAQQSIPQSGEIGVLLMQAMLQAGQSDQTIKLGSDLRGHGEVGPNARAVYGHALIRKGRLKEAETEFVAALTQAKQGKQLSFVFREIERAFRPDAEKGTLKLKGWIALRPDDWQMHLLCGGALMLQKHYKDAEKLFLKALELVKAEEGNRFEIFRQLGLTYYHLREYENCRKMYEGALKINPNDGVTLNNLAWMLAFDLKKAAEALPHAKRAVELAPYSAHALDTYGVVLEALEDYDKAAEILHRSVDIQELPANRLHLGSVYEKMNRNSDALRQYRAGWKLLEKDPDNAHYQSYREALKRLGDEPAERTKT